MNRTFHSFAGLAAILALSGSALGQSAIAQTQPATPAAPDPADSSTIASGFSAWSITSTQDGRTFKLDGKDGAITAEIDGKPVPADRVVLEGDTVRIKDEKGETIFLTQAPMSGASGQVFTLTSPHGSLFGAPRSRGIVGNHLFRADATAIPPVMIGVQLLDPDSSIRGHLGLKDNEATMISAVYEGLPAAQAGLEPYDIIVAVDGKSPAPPAVVRKALHDIEAGKSVSFKVIHHGQEKTLSVTPEKYDAEKLDKAKINAIAAATGAPSALAGAGNLDWGQWPQAWAGVNGQPFVATVPGQGSKPLTFWYSNPMNGQNGTQMNDFAKRMQEMAEQMRQQAEAAKLDAEKLHEQLLNQAGKANAAPRSAQGMDDRMKKMEEMLQKLMEQREKKSDDKSDSRS